MKSLVVSNYRRSTTTGNVEPTKENHRLAHYILVDKKDPNYKLYEQRGTDDGNGIPFTTRDNSNEAYILVGYQDENGDMKGKSKC